MVGDRRRVSNICIPSAREVLVPRSPGTLPAFGLLVSDFETDGVKTLFVRNAALADVEGPAIIEQADTTVIVDFRFRDSIDWRSAHPHLAAWFERFRQRESMVASEYRG